MNEKREAAKKLLAKIQPLVMAQQKAGQKDWEIYGEEITFTVNGKEKRAMFYSAGKENAPVYFDIHGGGFCWGSMVDGNFFCHQLAQKLGLNVFSLDYPLTPENVYPTQLTDLEETITYILKNPRQFGIDPADPAIGGRSAGGNLAAALCIRMPKGTFRLQVLDHPWLDLAGVIPESERYIPQGFNLLEALKNNTMVYAEEEERKGADISPVLAPQSVLSTLPPAIIQTCSLDSLRNDGDLYARNLQAAGVPVIHHTVEGAEHGFSEQDTPLGAQGRDWLAANMEKFYQ